MTIIGAGAASTIIQRDGPVGVIPPVGPRFRILHVAEAGSLRLEGVTIKNGALEFLEFAGGGGILNYGVTELLDSAVANNVLGVVFDDGAGIRNYGTLSLFGSRLENNTAVEAVGGGISNSGTMTIRQSTVSGNRSNDGGGILNKVGGTALITESTIADNRSFTGLGDGNGGGIWNAGHLTVVNSTIARNVANVFAFIGEGGGGIAARFGTVRIESCTISDNEVLGEIGTPGGGGIHSNAATVELRNTIVANNSVTEFGEPGTGPDCFGSIRSLGHNLVGDRSGCALAILGSDLFGDPGLDSFRDDRTTPGNGHYPLLETSRAIDAGDAATCTPNDQIGSGRVDGDEDGSVICDIGAIEFFPGVIDVSDLLDLAPLVTAYDPTPVPLAAAGRYRISATFTNKSSFPVHDPVFKVAKLSDGNLLLNADGGPGGANAHLTPDVGQDSVLSPGESFTTEFVIGLQARKRFTFFVDVRGLPAP